MKKITHLLLALSLACTLPVLAQIKTTSGLPSAVTDVFTKAQVPMSDVAILVKEVGVTEAIISHNIEKPMNPASVMKLVTTYAGLELLGAAHTWKTEVYVTGDMRATTLKGDLILKGTGDPKLTVERFWLLLKQLRERGLRTINGDLILDKTFFAIPEADPNKFDGEASRAYNVVPDALLLNFKAVRFQFAPAIDGLSVTISPDVKPTQLEIINRAKLVDAPCGDWRERIKSDIQTPSATELRITFTGNYPRSCGERVWNISLLDHARFVGGVFATMWTDVGGVWKGNVKVAATPREAKLIAVSESLGLSEVIRDINKFSNNVMARQLFLSLSADIDKQPATPQRSYDVVRQWLARKNIAAPELVIENGSGLSRIERISAANLGKLLDAAWRSAVMPEFISSMSLVGVDGTFRRRARGEVVSGRAHMKSGTLNDVRAIAGYVLAADERRYLMVMMVNSNNAIFTQAAQDALLQWVYARSLPAVPPVVIN